jgi:uncharacterized paraquat-inducible protein A
MPWCDVCDRLVDDDDMVEGSCPTCHENLTDAPRGPLPWRFRFMIAATVVYLGWRIYQGISWLQHH